ncbi:hypothetical protein GCM10010399_43960 [Dactylosporangium fulvum]|uniref:RusA-like resolvase n=1 Tax=Dactylosporangium fulvum TaxID=53359 RepID=A0ABY5W7T5_9ACTN|nr:hypothetical protein [Dactylosporangium fulvum]UWP85937.1 hypothetical protein Dfulv_17460 [Dactylosporangium fulvum]
MPATQQTLLGLLPDTLAKPARKPAKRRSPRVTGAAVTTRAEHTASVDRFGRRTWTLQIPAPADWLSANGRTHARNLAVVVKAWRDAARVYAIQAKLPKGLARVHVLARCHFTMTRTRDAGNRYPTAKACIDGLIDYGLADDDNDSFLVGPDMRSGPNVDRKEYPGGGLLVLTITELRAEDEDTEVFAA